MPPMVLYTWDLFKLLGSNISDEKKIKKTKVILNLKMDRSELKDFNVTVRVFTFIIFLSLFKNVTLLYIFYY